MLLALDIGNSAAKGGLFDGPQIVQVFRSDVPPPDASHSASVGTWKRALKPPVEAASIDRIGITTVVPHVLPAAEAALQDLAGAPITVVQPSMQLPFAMGYDTPETLGMDRLAAAVAAWAHWGKPAGRSVIAVDVGTAANYEVVSRDGVYRGGAIGAGPALAERALRTGTAQLPSVPLAPPSDPVGRSTQTALQSGIWWGTVDAVRGMLARLAETLPDAPSVVLTGGWSEALHPHLPDVDAVAPHLVLDGVRVLLETNA
jgi:type III pantothenate kinase